MLWRVHPKLLDWDGHRRCRWCRCDVERAVRVAWDVDFACLFHGMDDERLYRVERGWNEGRRGKHAGSLRGVV